MERLANSKNKNEEDLEKDEKERLRKDRKEFRMQTFNQWRKLMKIKSRFKAILQKIRDRKAEELRHQRQRSQPLLANSSPFLQDSLPAFKHGKQGLHNRSVDKTITEKDEEYLYTDLNVSIDTRKNLDGVQKLTTTVKIPVNGDS